jgi:hypothetical protein
MTKETGQWQYQQCQNPGQVFFYHFTGFTIAHDQFERKDIDDKDQQGSTKTPVYSYHCTHQGTWAKTISES